VKGRTDLRAIRVVIADDQTLFAEGVTSLLGADDRIEVVGHARDGEEAVELVETLEPDLVLMDVSMPRMDGIEATARIKEVSPETLVLFLTTSSSQDDVQRAAEVGAAGYLTKSAAASDLIVTIVELAALATLFPAQQK
jgi:DNA-binding NarL/FixJ family response regulator